jgi:heterodisulfide reductase subunit A-like polyferredoxin
MTAGYQTAWHQSGGGSSLFTSLARTELPERFKRSWPKSIFTANSKYQRAVCLVTLPGPMATEKVKRLVNGAVKRVVNHLPAETQYVPVSPATLVLGGGVAGIQASLEIASSHHMVYLVEREPSIGCGVCQEKCPWTTASEFDVGLGLRKAIYTPWKVLKLNRGNLRKH